MRNKIVQIIMIGVLCFTLVGCATNGTKEETQDENTSTATESSSMQADKIETNTTTKQEELDTQQIQDTSALSTQTQGDDDIYSIATDISKQDVENYMDKVKAAIVNQDMETLYPLISYPITIKGTEYKTQESLKAANLKFDESYIQEVQKADTKDMFCNYQGIMLGNGEVWIAEVLNKDNTSQGLKIIALNE